MKWKNSWSNLIFLIFGAFICYITLQFEYFDTKLELDVPNLLLGIITLFIGLYIADTLQKRVNKNQNQHSYLINKLDNLWLEFNDFSEKLSYDDKIDAPSIIEFNKQIIYPISFLKNVFNSFDVDDNCVCNLESNLEELDEILTNIPAENNIVTYKEKLPQIENKVLQINQCFSKILKIIQEL
jgi:hypothetical protein